MAQTLTIKLDIKNRDAEFFLREALLSSPDFCLNGNGSSCDVLIFEIGRDLEGDFKHIEQAKAKGLARDVFLISTRKDPEVLLRAMKTGVKEFFPAPLNKEEILAALSNLKRTAEAGGRAQAAKKGRVVSVIGSKGGVGTTTTAVNLAVSLKQRAGESSVVLMDMNPLLGGIHLFLDIKTAFTWADAARDIVRMDSTYLLNTLHKHPTGIHVLPAPPNPAAGFEAKTSEAMGRLVGLMRSSFDIIVMDGCTSFDELSLKMLALSDTILMVAELNLLSVVNAQKLLNTFEGLGLSYGKDIKLVINRNQKKPMISPEEAEKTLGRKIVLKIPNDYETSMSAINTGKTVADIDAKSPLARNFKELARLILDDGQAEKEKSPFLFIRENFRDLALRFHKEDGRRRNAF